MRRLTLYALDIEMLRILADAGGRVPESDVPKDHQVRGTMSRLVRSGNAYVSTVAGMVYFITDAGRAALEADAAPVRRRLTPMQTFALGRLAEADGELPKRDLRADRSTMNPLESDGLVTSRWDDDRHADMYAITDAGRALIEVVPSP